MSDQADELRQLVLRSSVGARAAATPPPPLIAVSGGRPAAGATTVAVNLGISLAGIGRRVVLVDVDLAHPDATRLCGVSAEGTVLDILAGRRTVHEVLQPGPGGIQLLPGCWTADVAGCCTPATQRHLIDQLHRLGPHCDLVILDTASGSGPILRRFWQAADIVMLVTNDEAGSIMDTYAAIKLLTYQDEPTEVVTLVNRIADQQEAADVGGRIQHACRRFLGREVVAADYLPDDALISELDADNRPFALENAARASRMCLERATNRLADLVGRAGRSRVPSSSAGAA